MDYTQFPSNGSSHPPFGIHSTRIKKASLCDGVSESLGVKVLPRPFRDSPDPDQHLKDFDSLPSLTNGSSLGSRTPCSSVVPEFEHPSYALDGPTASTAMQCSCDSQSLTGSNSPMSTPRDTNEANETSPRVLEPMGQENQNNIGRSSKVVVMSTRSAKNHIPAVTSGFKTPNTTESLEVQESDAGSSTESDDLDDDDSAEKHSNSSWRPNIQLLEDAALEAFGCDLDLAAFFLSNLDEILGLHNSRDILRQKVCSWIQYSPNSSETSSGKTQPSYASHSTGDSTGQNRKRQRSMNPNYPRGRRERDEDEDEQQERDPKKLKENEGGLRDGDPLLACPFWKRDPAKYNKHYLSDTNSKINKYGRCEGPGFPSMQRLKEHLDRKHTHTQCERCGAVFDGSDEPTRVKRLNDHLRLPVPCELRDSIIKEGISTTQWATLRKQADKKGKGNSRQIGMSTVEKWNEIWVVLFPNVPIPSNPWHDREKPQNPSLFFGDQTPLGNYRRLFERALNQKSQTGEISINEVTISQVVDLGAQILHFTLSQGVQDLTLGTSSGRPHSSDYGSLLGGSYLDVNPSSAGTTIRDQNMNHLSDLGAGIQGAPQTDMAPGLHTNSSPVINVNPVYVQGIDHNAMPSMNNSSGAMNQFEPFHAGTPMARAISNRYIPTFGSNPSFGNNFRLDGEPSFAIPHNSFFNGGLHSYGNGNQNNENQVVYQTRARTQPSNASQFRNRSEFGHPPHDPRR